MAPLLGALSLLACLALLAPAAASRQLKDARKLAQAPPTVANPAAVASGAPAAAAAPGTCACTDAAPPGGSAADCPRLRDAGSWWVLVGAHTLAACSLDAHAGIRDLPNALPNGAAAPRR